MDTFLYKILSCCVQLSACCWLNIIIFTMISKVILFPLSLWSHKNSLKMVSLIPDINKIKTKYYGDKDSISDEIHQLFKQKGYHPFLALIPLVAQILFLFIVIRIIHMIADKYPDSSVGMIPVEDGGWFWLVPCFAGISAMVMGWAQNHLNPLQREQSFQQKFVTNTISVMISLCLGCFVEAGVGLYWIASNILSILVQIACSMIYNPKKFISYYTLCRSKLKYEKFRQITYKKVSLEDKKREKADYKKFFSVANKHLVFYSEASGFYKYFRGVIEYLISHSNIIVHYVTSDPNDQIFEIAKTQQQIRPYFIGETRLITLFMKMDADIVVMTMPDLNNFHYKRSYIRKDIEYIYMFHGLTNMGNIRKGALNHYDTIFCDTLSRSAELRAIEKYCKISPKKLVPFGYGVVDDMVKNYDAKKYNVIGNRKKFLIAPSWQENNILESCLWDIVELVLPRGHEIIVRPHPQFLRRNIHSFQNLTTKASKYSKEQFRFETDFASEETMYSADMIITDWSGIGYEFALATGKPVVFINTKPKIVNPEYQRYFDSQEQQSDSFMRESLGHSINPSEINEKIIDIISQLEQYNCDDKSLSHQRDKILLNVGQSACKGGNYILEQLMTCDKRGKYAVPL